MADERNHRSRVLVVEDDPANRHLAIRILERAGYLVEQAEGGPRALEMAEATPLDLVLMDLSMPGMDGFETTRRLRQLAGHATTPVIALTAHAMTEDSQKAIAAGCDVVMVKPYRPAELIATVTRVLGTPDIRTPD